MGTEATVRDLKAGDARTPGVGWHQDGLIPRVLRVAKTGSMGGRGFETSQGICPTGRRSQCLALRTGDCTGPQGEQTRLWGKKENITLYLVKGQKTEGP